MAGLTLTEALPGTGPITASGFRPWWETIRYYSLNAILAIDLMIYYITYSFSTADCIPYPEEMSTLSAPNTKFVNSVCFRQVDKVYRFAGRNILIGFILLHLAYSWWEMIPKVRDRFVAVKKVDKQISEKHFQKGEVEKLLESLSENKEKALFLADTYQRLFVLKTRGCHLFYLYHLRNLIASGFVALAIFAMAMKFPIKLDEDADAIFICSVSNETAKTVGFKKFSCSTNLKSQLQTYFLAILCILGFIELITLSAFIASIIVMRSIKVTEDAPEDLEMLSKDYALVLFFTRHSSRVNNSTKEMLMLHCGEKSIKARLTVLFSSALERLRTEQTDDAEKPSWKDLISSLEGATKRSFPSGLDTPDATDSVKSYEAKELHHQHINSQALKSNGRIFVDGSRFVVTQVPGDGNCFFHAVEDQLKFLEHPKKYTHAEIRELVCDEMRKNPDLYSGFLEEETMEDYVNKMSKDKTFAESLVFPAAAKVLACSIVIVFLDENNRRSLHLFGDASSSRWKLYLALQNEHYWSLRPERSPRDSLKSFKSISESTPVESATKPLEKQTQPKINQIFRALTAWMSRNEAKNSATTSEEANDKTPSLSSESENLMEMQTLNRRKEKFRTQSSPNASVASQNSKVPYTSVPVSESDEESGV